MGNVAIAFIESTVSFSGYVQIKRQKRIEHKRIRSLIPRYLARLNNSDISITTLNLNGLGVDSTILRLLSYPFLSGETRVQVKCYPPKVQTYIVFGRHNLYPWGRQSQYYTDMPGGQNEILL